jgi:signal transduction histidine kinase
MPPWAWLRPPRRLLTLFLVSTLVPAVALVWLGWRMLELDRTVARQHLHDRLERSADVIAASIEHELETIDEQLPAWLKSPPDRFKSQGVVVASFTAAGLETTGGAPLLYTASRSLRAEPPPAVWAPGETLEFRGLDYDGAAAAFRALTRSEDAAVRAGALVRLARVLRKSNKPADALEAYAALAELGSVPVAGEPAALVARTARCGLRAELGQVAELKREAAVLAADLEAGRWPVDRETLLFHWEQARRWQGEVGSTSPTWQDGLARATAIDGLWRDWSARNHAAAGSRGRRSQWIDDRSVLLVWRASGERLHVFAAAPAFIAEEWGRIWKDQRAVAALIDADGHRMLADASATGPEALRTAADRGLPWTLRVASADPDGELALLAGRRGLLLIGVALLAFLIVAGAYLVARAVHKERAVARLQSDFVAAVSHEFRTPLTSMRHLMEMLRTRPDLDDARRHKYYDVLSHDTERLYRFVETLLDFGRMEAGAEQYRFEPLDAASAVSSVVDDFRAEVAASRHPIVVQPEGAVPPLRADRDAFGRALWNLLDNAAKYSPADAPIHVGLGRENGRVAISVRDQGCGVAPADRERIFQKFVRGAGARESGIKGTGVGLAMVDRIVRAHGGEIRLDSEPGNGSTFTMLLPAAEPRA